MSFIPRRNEEQVFLFSNFNEFIDLVDYINRQPEELEPKNQDFASNETYTIIYNLEYDGGLNNDNEQTFDFNNIVFNGIADDISIILPANTSIDFKGLTWKNMYRENNTLFKCLYSTTSYQHYYGWTIIKNANFFNFVINGGGIYNIAGNYAYSIFNFINCNFSIISRDSKQNITLFNYSLFNTCTINFNIDRRGSELNFGVNLALLNCTLKLTGVIFSNSAPFHSNTVFNGTKIIGDIKIIKAGAGTSQFLAVTPQKYLGKNPGFNVIDMNINVQQNSTGEPTIINYLTAVNKTKIKGNMRYQSGANYSEFQMQSEDPSASDYIYSYENLKNLGFLIATEIP